MTGPRIPWYMLVLWALVGAWAVVTIGRGVGYIRSAPRQPSNTIIEGEKP